MVAEPPAGRVGRLQVKPVRLGVQVTGPAAEEPVTAPERDQPAGRALSVTVGVVAGPARAPLLTTIL